MTDPHDIELETTTEEASQAEGGAGDDAWAVQPLDELVQQYMEAQDAEQAEVMAAFTAGTLLRVKDPLEIYDPIEDASVRVRAGEYLTVAAHEGDVLVGELADNSHSIGVLYEEAHRWYQRKYFLPLGLLVDRGKVEVDPEALGAAPMSRAPLKGLEHEGTDRRTHVAVRRIEGLELRDQAAFLPRGVVLVLARGAEARDPETGQGVTLAPGTEAEVTAPVGDVESLGDDALGDGPAVIPVRVGERALELPFELLGELDPDTEVLTLADLTARQAEAMDRRRATRRLVGLGLAAVCVAGTGGWWVARQREYARTQRPEPAFEDGTSHDAHRVAASLVPQVAALYGYFSSGNQYWWKLRGAMMDLREQGSEAAARRLAAHLDDVSAVSSSLFEIYRACFYRVVHVGWHETRHYRTDSKGKRHYTHSTWSKVHRSMWVEPRGLRGFHGTLQRWSDSDEHRRSRAHHLVDHPLFDLLVADPEHPERTFAVDKRLGSFGRDAAVAMTTLALTTLPPAFYDDFWALADGRALERTPVAPGHGLFPHQKQVFTTAAMVGGVVLARRFQRRLDETMATNKYELGQALEREIRRVPGLAHDEAFAEWFQGPPPAALVERLRARVAALEGCRPHLSGFTYTYGSGWDSGRPLDSIYVDPGPLARALPQLTPQWPRLADALAGYFAVDAHRDAMAPVLRNAIGTEIVELQIAEDRSEAQGGSWKRGLWFAAPLWGAVMIDGLLKGVRAG